MEDLKIPPKLVRLMGDAYVGSESCVRVDEEHSKWFTVSAGVRQGCVWSLLFFSTLIDWVLQHSLGGSG